MIWRDEHKNAFNELKNYLSNPPILSALIKDEPLFLYLAIFEVVVSAVLFREEQGKKKKICMLVECF